jgi:hypothetical protein
MFKNFITHSFIVGSLSVLLACGGKGGFQTSTSATDGGNSGASAGSGNDSNSARTEFQKLQYKGYVSGGNNDGALVVDIDKAAGALLLILPLQMNSFISSIEGDVADVPGLKYMTYKDDKGASYIAITVPLRYALKGANHLPSARLPNGDALPQIVKGELPSVAVTLPGKNRVQIHFFIGVKTLGVFVSSPYDPYVALQFPIRNGVETIGSVFSIPAKQGFDGGFFLSTQMPASIAGVIDDHFRF